MRCLMVRSGVDTVGVRGRSLKTRESNSRDQVGLVGRASTTKPTWQGT